MWKSQELEVLPGNDEEALVAFEQRWQVRLPPDVRSYFEVLNGVTQGNMDEKLLTFWELDRMRPVVAELGEWRYSVSLPEHENCFIFADFLISSHWYAVRMSYATTVFEVYDNHCREVASSFREFSTRYLSHPDFPL
jgi:hypothetical protein